MKKVKKEEEIGEKSVKKVNKGEEIKKCVTKFPVSRDAVDHRIKFHRD